MSLRHDAPIPIARIDLIRTPLVSRVCHSLKCANCLLEMVID